MALLFTRAELEELGRCTRCGWHPPTQGHHPHCPYRKRKPRKIKPK